MKELRNLRFIMISTETLKIELNELTVYQLRNLQHAINKKLKEKTAIKEPSISELLTNEELDMLAEVMKV
jgi:transcriptional regulator of met regulon